MFLTRVNWRWLSPKIISPEQPIGAAESVSADADRTDGNETRGKKTPLFRMIEFG